MLTDASTDGPSVRHRHPLLAAMAFVATIVVLVGATVFAFVAASGTDGASDPVGAVQELLDAVSRNDALGVLEALPPDEREAFRDSLPDIADQLQRLGVVNPVSLSNLPGVTIELRNLRFRTDQLFNEVGRVAITDGQLVVTPIGGFPLPDRTRRLLQDDFHAEVDPSSGARTIDLGATRPNIVAVKDSGGWHASLLYTVAEAIRGGGSGPLPRFNAGPTPTGSPTPDAAVRDLFVAGTNLDPTRAVSLANPAESRALYDYASLFLPEALRRARAIEEDEPFALHIKQLDVAVDGTGSTREARVRSADIALDDGGEHVEEIYTGGCLTTLRTDDGADPVSTTRCDGTIEPAPPANGRSAEPSRVDRLTGWQTLGRAFPTFVVQERNGRWYISPVRSVLTTFDEVLQHLQPADVGALADRLAWAWDLYALPDAPDTRN